MCVCTGGPSVAAMSGLGLCNPGGGAPTQTCRPLPSPPWGPEGEALAKGGSVSCAPPPHSGGRTTGPDPEATAEQ